MNLTPEFKGSHIASKLNGVEVRTLKATCNGGLNIRELDGGVRAIEGYAIVFNSLSESFGTTEMGKDFREIILPQAVDGCLDADIRCLFNHESGNVLGRTKAGTLTLTKDAFGVRFSVKLQDTSLANDLLKNIRAGNIDGCSFGFMMDGWDDDTVDFEERSDMVIRKIKKIASIHEVSVVTFPAFPATSVSARDLLNLNPDLNTFLAKTHAAKPVECDNSLDNLSLLQRRLELQTLEAKICNI